MPHPAGVGVRFLYRVQVGPAGVLGEHDGAGLLVGEFPHEAGRLVPPQHLADGPEAALAGHDLITAGVGAHGDGLGEAVGGDAGGEVGQGGRVEVLAVVVAGADAGAGEHLDGGFGCGHGWAFSWAA